MLATAMKMMVEKLFVFNTWETLAHRSPRCFGQRHPVRGQGYAPHVAPFVILLESIAPFFHDTSLRLFPLWQKLKARRAPTMANIPPRKPLLYEKTATRTKDALFSIFIGTLHLQHK
ncbi:hypothetical protein G3N56_01425 [Desulfovibrio sulfodismutans]|uniref:Uncharacterized protein n=1 Tax=Desulfolutivibrio sulfodismutans TaxID=63561 RepID=A0A7K3NHX0_9BACT|nr:hypothetical protein [Desulfolutivibrio sulfodismutans]NDY55403.1 hypothetical protein [Desulfolutivibrio sulfodismutans]QLA12222.1 hypothetical protein GD606_08015 [Desulfolutivibrio sulfodismutans DSM 3696]